MGAGVGVVLVRVLGPELMGLRVGVDSAEELVRGLGLLAVEVRVGAVGDFVTGLEWVQELVPVGLVMGVAGGVEGLARVLVMVWALKLAQVLVQVWGQVVGWEADVKAAWHACQPFAVQVHSFCDCCLAATMSSE